jgi:hypothetical protein
MPKLQSVVIVAHKFLTQPDDDLVLFLNGLRVEKVLHICHSFSDAPDRRSSFRLYRNGELAGEGCTRDLRSWPEPIIYLREMFFTAFWTLRKARRWDLYVGMDGLCVLCGNFLRALGVARKTVYWAIDFVPKDRFANRLKNFIYAAVNRSGYLRADEVWDLSPRMAQARSRFGGIDASAVSEERRRALWHVARPAPAIFPRGLRAAHAGLHGPPARKAGRATRHPRHAGHSRTDSGLPV